MGGPNQNNSDKNHDKGEVWVNDQNGGRPNWKEGPVLSRGYITLPVSP